MIGKIKIIGANNQTHLDWMEKEFVNCELEHQGGSIHNIKIPDRVDVPFDIYKSLFTKDRVILEGFARIEDCTGRLAIEFFPQ
jgi:hypothetical protein